jgi:hypothetical protein
VREPGPAAGTGSCSGLEAIFGLELLETRPSFRTQRLGNVARPAASTAKTLAERRHEQREPEHDSHERGARCWCVRQQSNPLLLRNLARLQGYFRRETNESPNVVRRRD